MIYWYCLIVLSLLWGQSSLPNLWYLLVEPDPCSVESVRLYNFCINSSFHQQLPFPLDPDVWFTTNMSLTLSYPNRFYNLSIWKCDQKKLVGHGEFIVRRSKGENYHFPIAIMGWSAKTKQNKNKEPLMENRYEGWRKTLISGRT